MITDRIAVKTGSVGVENWTWMFKPDKKFIPTEIMAPYLMRNLVGSENITAIRNYRIHYKELVYFYRLRLYMEYCPLDDVDGMIMDDRADPTGWGFHKLRRIVGNNAKSVLGMIPEPLLWHLVESMARVGQIMTYGTLDETDPAWRFFSSSGNKSFIAISNRTTLSSALLP
ncbi:hypothetical protein K470DRAFT_290818 [Piedraia hortae CBS 480.64]|uniref:Uncharacterized protein n=1 Tax=Piedraia hortae CBS 480.64 TaxID=1314780 RepID=A0A6A7BQU6_9PEZI|nr:hypothetical protein K470DRAFT_290818 [Piedraia hortae CBS 480.64]